MRENPKQYPRVGVGILIVKDGKVLVGKRKGSHASGEYALPGGHLDYMESLEECARREVREETGIEIDDIRLFVLTTIRDFAPLHYVQINFVADWKSGEPQLMEPEKNEGWEWYGVDEIPQPLFRPSLLVVEAFRSGKPLIDLRG